jgi:hypothetical protein
LQCANVFDDVEVETRGAKALATNINSPTHPKAGSILINMKGA